MYKDLNKSKVAQSLIASGNTSNVYGSIYYGRVQLNESLSESPEKKFQQRD